MKRIALLIISVFLFNQLKAQTDSTDIYKLSFEDLLSVNIKAGTLFKIKTQNLPVYITTITEDQIRNSGAKHMADLMEIYVPDLMYLLHTQVRIGSRGIINDRQEKTLVLVNGHCINQKTAIGATLEFTNWDLNDIERIDIISGPGSVTYGPGAICSVISITTKNANTSPGIKAGLQYANTFQSKLAYASYGLKKDKFSAYVYGSYTATSGGAEGDFFSTKANGVADYQVKDNTMAKIFGDCFVSGFTANGDHI